MIFSTTDKTSYRISNNTGQQRKYNLGNKTNKKKKNIPRGNSKQPKTTCECCGASSESSSSSERLPDTAAADFDLLFDFAADEIALWVNKFTPPRSISDRRHRNRRRLIWRVSLCIIDSELMECNTKSRRYSSPAIQNQGDFRFLTLGATLTSASLSKSTRSAKRGSPSPLEFVTTLTCLIVSSLTRISLMFIPFHSSCIHMQRAIGHTVRVCILFQQLQSIEYESVWQHQVT